MLYVCYTRVRVCAYIVRRTIEEHRRKARRQGGDRWRSKYFANRQFARAAFYSSDTYRSVLYLSDITDAFCAVLCCAALTGMMDLTTGVPRGCIGRAQSRTACPIDGRLSHTKYMLSDPRYA